MNYFVGCFLLFSLFINASATEDEEWLVKGGSLMSSPAPSPAPLTITLTGYIGDNDTLIADLDRPGEGLPEGERVIYKTERGLRGVGFFKTVSEVVPSGRLLYRGFSMEQVFNFSENSYLHLAHWLIFEQENIFKKSKFNRMVLTNLIYWSKNKKMLRRINSINV